MIMELLKLGKITQYMYEIYTLFHATEIGRNCLDRMTKQHFMEEPGKDTFNRQGFAFIDGRRSVVRDIHGVIDTVNDLIKKEVTNDDGK